MIYCDAYSCRHNQDGDCHKTDMHLNSMGVCSHIDIPDAVPAAKPPETQKKSGWRQKCKDCDLWNHTKGCAYKHDFGVYPCETMTYTEFVQKLK